MARRMKKGSPEAKAWGKKMKKSRKGTYDSTGSYKSVL